MSFKTAQEAKVSWVIERDGDVCPRTFKDVCDGLLHLATREAGMRTAPESLFRLGLPTLQYACWIAKVDFPYALLELEMSLPGKRALKRSLETPLP